jgi:hypothetical protein
MARPLQIDQSSDPPRARWTRTVAFFHKVEIVYVLSMLAVSMWSVLRADRELIQFAVIWGGACIVAAGVALWPHTPRTAHFIAEAVLLVVALGQLIGPQHDLLRFLNREIRGATRWNELPLTERRIFAWNVCAAFGLIWGIPGVFMFAGVVQLARESLLKSFGALLLFAAVWGMLGFLFVLIIDSFFRG